MKGASWEMIITYLIFSNYTLFCAAFMGIVMGIVLLGFLIWHFYLIFTNETTAERHKKQDRLKVYEIIEHLISQYLQKKFGKKDLTLVAEIKMNASEMAQLEKHVLYSILLIR